jgi:Flp pilus assembly secretin CpaC
VAYSGRVASFNVGGEIPVLTPTKDLPAIRLIMGHADESIDATYRESIDDDRLVAVSDHVRKWLFGDAVQ